MLGPELIRRWGYPVEVVHVTTQDGFVLEMHRIPHGRGTASEPSADRPVVLFVHGLEGDSKNWIANLPEQSAGFMFADAGFDVWLGNVRGSTYSMTHTNYTRKDSAFWSFSWEEMFTYDLTAMVDTALRTSGQRQLYYVGHSQGSLIMFARLSTDKEFASKIKKFFALAPIGRVNNTRGALRVIADTFYRELEWRTNTIGAGMFFPYGEIVIGAYASHLCTATLIMPFAQRICPYLMGLVGGPNLDNFNITRIPVYLSQEVSGTSTQNVLHWSRMIRYGLVAHYDYKNETRNMQHYGQETPPSFNFTAIQTEMYLWWSSVDWLSNPTDLKEYLFKVLNPQYVKLLAELDGFTHLHFIWGLNAAEQIYRPIIRIIQEDIPKP